MPRRTPQERKYLIAALKKLAKRKDVGGPTILAAIDRVAVLDGLYEVELVRPRERPDKWADKAPVSLPEPAQPNDDDELKKFAAEFNKRHYGGVNGKPEPGTSGPADS
jgi:hypothetical protein